MPKPWPTSRYDADDLRAIKPKPKAAPRTAARMYSGAKQSLLTSGFGSYADTSADAELESGLTMLRARSRQLMRDAPYAKRARVLVVNNVIGPGIGLQAQVKTTRGDLNKRVNEAIEAAWNEWCCAEYCHTGGALHFSDLERAAKSEVFTAGEVFIRMHPRPFGASKVPLALELIEAERLMDGMATPAQVTAAGNEFRMGVEVDSFGRAVAYWFRQRHPGDNALRTARDNVIRVPAEQVIHLRIVDRWPQTRGEPWLHAALRKLNDMAELTTSELLAARMAANYFATVSSSNEDPLPTDAKATEATSDGAKQLSIEPGTIDVLDPGLKLDFHAPNRPNAALDPFMRMMLREFAVGSGVSYASVSGDYSQSNYSSSRLALLDDRDLWRVLQAWWIRSFREPLHKLWMQQAVFSGALPEIPIEQYAAKPELFQAVRWKPRGWSWIDPKDEVDAYAAAVKAGFTTVSAVIAQTGGGVDIEDVIAERKEELEMFDEAGIKVDTTLEDPPEAPAAAPASPAPKAPAGDGGAASDPNDDGKPARVVSIAR